MIEKLLEELGLSEYEIKVYLALLSSGPSTAGKVAEIAKVNRRNVYDALSRLCKKGFVTEARINNQKTYSPLESSKIISSFQEKLDLAKSLETQMHCVKHANAQEVHVFEGNEGMKNVFNKMLQNLKPIYVIGSTGNSIDRLPFFMPQLFMKKLNQIKIQQLWNPDAKNRSKYRQMLKSEDRILPFKTSTQLFLCGDTSIILIWTSTPVAISITNPEINIGFKKYFDFLWRISKPA